VKTVNNKSKTIYIRRCFTKSHKAPEATFIGLTICAKMIGGGRPLRPEILGRTDSVEAKLPIFNLFSPIAPHP